MPSFTNLISMTVAALLLLFSPCSYSGSSLGLARSVEATIADLEPTEWPEHCIGYRNDGMDDAVALQRLHGAAIEPGVDGPPVVIWNGVRIPVPDAAYHSVALIPGSIGGVLSEKVGVVVSRIDLAAHFEHFEGIEGFGEYVRQRDTFVQWLAEGLSIRPDDIVCQPTSLQSDLVRIVHSLVAGIAVTVSGETFLMRLEEPVPGLLVGGLSGGGRDVRVQFLFQNPESDRSQLVTVTYRFRDFTDVLGSMNGLAAAIAGGAESSDPASHKIVTAILDGDYRGAAEIAESQAIEVRTAPP